MDASWANRKTKKIDVLKYHFLLFYAITANHFLIKLWRVMKLGFSTTTGDDQDQWLHQEEAPRHLPKPNLHQKKIMVIASWSAAHLIHYSFQNPSETIASEKYAQQINEMNRKLQCLHLALVNRKGPILHDNTQPHIT